MHPVRRDLRVQQEALVKLDNPEPQDLKETPDIPDRLDSLVAQAREDQQVAREALVFLACRATPDTLEPLEIPDKVDNRVCRDRREKRALLAQLDSQEMLVLRDCQVSKDRLVYRDLKGMWALPDRSVFRVKPDHLATRE